MRRKFFFCILIFICSFAAAQSPWEAMRPRYPEHPWWYTLERGKLHFREGSFGAALISFDAARREREQYYTRLEQELIDLLSLPEVRILGDSLDRVETFIFQAYRPNAAAALEELYFRVPRSSLGGSAANAASELRRLKPYPEAEYWLGETYRAEGELGIALKHYKNAYDSRELLDTPGFDLEILYRMAALHRLRQEYQEMESCLLAVLGFANPVLSGRYGIFWAGNGNILTAAMLRILENYGVERFLTLYRNDNFQAERSHRLLGIYYYASNRHESAVEHLMFSFLIQNTILINEVRSFQFDYEFTSLESLMDRIERRRDIKDWIAENQYYRTVYYLACALHATGKTIPAEQLWNFLAGQTEAGEWQGKSRSQLLNPFIERHVELP